MTDLSDKSNELLEAARADSPAPSRAVRARMKRAVLLSIGAPVSAAAGAGAAVGAVKAGLLSTLLLGGAAVVVGAAGTWGVIHHSSAPRAPPRSRALATRPPATRVEVVEPALDQPELVAGAAVEPPAIVPPARRAGSPAPRPPPALDLAVAPLDARAEPPTPEVAAPSRRRTESEEVRLREELQALAAAKADSDAHQWNRALEALDRYDSRFPNGVLSPEAGVLRVLCLCGLERREDARALASSLARAAPDSPGVQRLKTSCAAP